MKRFFVTLMVIAVAVLNASPVAANTEQPPVLSTNDLVENSYKWDGKTVSFKGEVLQDLMARADGTWMNLSDGNNVAMGVFVPGSVAMPVITHTEDYRTVGDVVLITGVFHRTCVQHEGETDIHATSVAVVIRGTARANPIHQGRIVWLLVLVCLLGVVMRFYYRKPTAATRHSV